MREKKREKRRASKKMNDACRGIFADANVKEQAGDQEEEKGTRL